MSRPLLRPLSVLAVAMLLLAASAHATVYRVSPTGARKSLAAFVNTLLPGDIVEVEPGVYNEVMKITCDGTVGAPITIRGVGATRPIFDAVGKSVTGAGSIPRAVFQIEGDNIVMENLEMRNARNGDNGSGIRVLHTTAHNTVIRNVRITYCDMGVMGGALDRMVFENSEVAFNGTSAYDGYSHNFYLGGVGTATVRGNYIHDALNGQNFKSRAHYNELLYNWIADSQDGEIGPVDEAGATDIPNSNFLMVGNTVVTKVRPAGYNNMRVLLFGHDSGGLHDGTMYLFNNTFISKDSRNRFLWIDQETGKSKGVAQNNIFYAASGTPGLVAASTSSGLITGSYDWMKTGTATLPGSFTNMVTGGSPGFVNYSGSNFTLLGTSNAVNSGTNGLAYYDGSGVRHDVVAAFNYVLGHGIVPRYLIGRPDIGAYESVPCLDGDANGDMAVNVQDLAIMAYNYNRTLGGTWLEGDFSGDGKIDVSDLAILASNYNQTVPPGLYDGPESYAGIGPTVPEPLTAGLLLCGAALVRRRRQIGIGFRNSGR